MKAHSWMIARIFIAGLATAALGGCANTRVHIDRDPAADLASFRTFGFLEPLSTDTARYSTLMTTHLKRATRTQMEMRGYIYEENSPDIAVNFNLRLDDRQDVRSVGYHGFRVGIYRAWPTGIETEFYQQGTLSVDLVATRTHSLVWRGVAEGRIDEHEKRDPAKAIDEAVAEVFREFDRPAVAGIGGV